MPVSIITRSYRTSELRNLVSYLEINKETEKEVIAVSVIKDCDIDGAEVIIEDSNRFEARITGIKKAHFDKILLLDSDQIPEDGLLSELDAMDEHMVIIPERSQNKGLTSKCMDDWRMRNEKLARTKISPYIPVVPRFYRREPLMQAIYNLPNNVRKIISHEDSVLYYEVFKITRNIGFSEKYIYNIEPNFIKLMHKCNVSRISGQSEKLI